MADMMKHLFFMLLVLLAQGVAAPVAKAGPDDCLDAPYRAAGSATQERLVGLVDRLRLSLREFPALLTVLDDNRPHLCLSARLVEEKAFYDPAENRIVLASDMAPGLAEAVLVHELRHLYQNAHDICPSDDLAMDQYARAVFALEADANVISLLVAWQQKTQGRPAMWQALADWPMTADIAARYSGTLAETQDIAGAAAAAFDQWYASGTRRERYYIASCSDYLDRQDDAHGLPRYQKLPGDFLSQLCRLPGGGSYDCRETPGALAR